MQCKFCPELVDTKLHNCGYESRINEVSVPGFNSPIKNVEHTWFHLECYIRHHDRKPLLTLVPKPEFVEVIKPKRKTTGNETITFPPTPLKTVEVKSKSMSVYFEDVSMAEIEKLTEKSSRVLMRRLTRDRPSIKDRRRYEPKWPKPRGNKGNPDWATKRDIDKEADEYEDGITRNIKIIEGTDKDGNPIVRDLAVDVNNVDEVDQSK